MQKRSSQSVPLWLEALEALLKSGSGSIEGTARAALHDWQTWMAREKRLAPEEDGFHRTLWRIEEFAAAHGISRRHVFLLLQRGALKGVRAGNRTLISDASRRSWLAGLPDFQSGGASAGTRSRREP
jgi:hypothetical protein